MSASPAGPAVSLSSTTHIAWRYVIPIVGVHVLALLALVPELFSWSAFAVMAVGVPFFGQGINIGYHRLLAHRSFTARPLLRRAFILLGLCCFEDTPARWVANHRYHHKHSDDEPDPHTPLVSFFWGHVGWLMVHSPERDKLSFYEQYAPDVLRDRFCLQMEKTPSLVLAIWLAQLPPFFAAGFGLGALLAPTGAGPWSAGAMLGASFVVWGVVVRTVAVWHITWSVNSLTHLFGYRNYAGDEHSTNNWLVALLSLGEGWHNNHHHDPASASNQRRWWELDFYYYEIKILEWLGLVRDVLPPRERRGRGRAQTAEGPEPAEAGVSSTAK